MQVIQSPSVGAVDAASSLIGITVWDPAGSVDILDTSMDLPSEGLRWFDLAPGASPGEAFELLAPVCDGLELEMLEDLCSPDEIPEPRAWHWGTVRLASTFGVYAPGSVGIESSCRTPSAEATYQPVELLANRDWLITRWHSAGSYCGAELVKVGAPLDHAGLVQALMRRWMDRSGGNAGDLGVLVMEELSLTYAPAHRRLYAALENWELNLYGPARTGGKHRPDPIELRDLWGARARLRDWLNPLNVPGIRRDINKAWLPATDHQLVTAVDERVDKALGSLAKLGETLRSTFHLLHIEEAEAQRDRSDKVQRQLAILATIFLIPTLIVGFYGANTWVPGQGRHWGFWIMVGVLVLFTAIGVTVISTMFASRNRQRRRLVADAKPAASRHPVDRSQPATTS